MKISSRRVVLSYVEQLMPLPRAGSLGGNGFSFEAIGNLYLFSRGTHFPVKIWKFEDGAEFYSASQVERARRIFLRDRRNRAADLERPPKGFDGRHDREIWFDNLVDL